MISSDEIRKRYIDFFKSKGHAEIAGASLIPENDPTVLFTTAGMHPLVPVLMGDRHPAGKRLVNFQKCIRTGDIEDVGDAWHLTFFEMLGNWSLGDYFKKEAIEMSFEFLTGKKWLNIPVERLSVTCFAGDTDAPKEEEAAKTWEKCGIPKGRIHFLPKKDNWWGPAGQTGPCGPDTEMFFHVKDVQEKNTADFVKLCKEEKFCEIWNDVFMQYNKTAEGKYAKASQQNVDTGFGLERTTAVLNDLDNAYETDLLKPTFGKVKELAGKKELDGYNLKSARIITDHLRAATFILGDEKGVAPSNVGQGYVLRRLIRKSIRHARLLGIKGNFCTAVAETVVKRFEKIYPELKKNSAKIYSELEKEEERFFRALETGTKLLEKKLQELAKQKKTQLDCNTAFDLYQSYGFPLEMIAEICKEKGFEVDSEGFGKCLLGHQEVSRKGAEQTFKGGLADTKEQTTRLHTATHLLHAALMDIVNKNIIQKGSNITAERLRFDFNSDERLSDEQLKKVGEWVNKAIQACADVNEEVLSVEEAKKKGAHGIFDSKYGEKVKVYTVTDGKKVYSKEICGGPHVKTVKGMGHFKILKQESVATGVKRIKAVLE
jgi:alanyl-tRNA synthetase